MSRYGFGGRRRGLFLAAGFDPFAFGHGLRCLQKRENRKGKTLCRWDFIQKTGVFARI